MSQSFAYDNIGRLVDSKTRRSAEQRRSRHYRWGSADRLLSIEDDRYGLTQYSYSPSGELTMATYADGRKECRLSDKVGNLYNDPDKKLRKYLEGGRIEKSGEWTFKYDKDGQPIEKFRGKSGFFGTKKDRWEYSWNQNGTLKGVFAPHRYGQWTSFTYDALGRRLTKLGDATFHYLWNGNIPLHEWQTGERYEDGGLRSYSEDLKTWLFEEESFVPLALIQEGKAYSIVCDQLGTPTEAYNEEGKEVWYRRLDMNGKVLEETQPGLNPEGYVSIPFLFQGQYYDHETGLAYNRFRYYDPELGRYISEDPIRLASDTLTMLSYVGDTNGLLDLFGLAPWGVGVHKFDTWWNDATLEDISRNLKSVKSHLRGRGGLHEMFPVSIVQDAKRLGFSSTELRDMVLPTKGLIFNYAGITGAYHRSKSSYLFHKDLISKLKLAGTKEDAQRIIQTMHEEHVVGYKSKK